MTQATLDGDFDVPEQRWSALGADYAGDPIATTLVLPKHLLTAPRSPGHVMGVTAAKLTLPAPRLGGRGGVAHARNGTNYRVGNTYRRRQVQVAVVGESLEISIGEELIRTHAIRHDRTREHGALANPGGRPRRINAA
ncbi:MAG: hypothetical protein QOC92_786 [Acidimicrobiaceae bacterium]